eukprot:1444072-Pyramimonas_sp.AAC.1
MGGSHQRIGAISGVEGVVCRGTNIQNASSGVEGVVCRGTNVQNASSGAEGVFCQPQTPASLEAPTGSVRVEGLNLGTAHEGYARSRYQRAN